MAPEERTLWYRILYRKIPCQQSRAIYDPDTSPVCSFYRDAIEDRSHLLINCSVKFSVWSTALAYSFPYMQFSDETISNVMFSLTQAPLIDNTALLCLVARILRIIWRHHWLFILEQVPFSHNVVLAKILLFVLSVPFIVTCG